MRRGRGERRCPEERRRQGPRLDPSQTVVGRHPAAALLLHRPERVRRVHLLEGAKGLEEVERLARGAGLRVARTSREALDALVGKGMQHQGVVVETEPYAYAPFDEALERVEVALVLDGVEDPRNLGAAARAALCLGAGLLVIPARRAAEVTASAHKAAAGALAVVDVARVENLRRALEEMKAAGFWIVGAEADAEAAPWDVDLLGKVALIVGGEDRGLRRLTRESCDFVVSIPMAAEGQSLNAADAATVLLYEALRQRRQAAGRASP